MDFRETNKQVVAEFRANGGHGSIGPVNFEHCVLLTTTGRRPGKQHTTPLGYVRDEGGNFVLFASNMASPTDPDWFGNLSADPHVHVEITGAEWDAVAQLPTGAAREAAYELWISNAPHVADHQEQAGRQIPIVLVPPPPT